MDLPDPLPDTPYTAVAFRLTHFHFDEDEQADAEGSLVLEMAGQLPGTDADVLVPFEMTPELALDLITDLVAQYHCIMQGPPDDDEDDDL